MSYPLPQLPAQPSRFLLQQAGLIRLTGADRTTFLQGQLTCDLRPLQPGDQTLGAHCDAKGKVWNAFRLLVQPEQILLLSRSSALPVALATLKKYAVFSKVELSDITAELPVQALAGAGTDQWLAAQGITAATLLGEAQLLPVATDRWLLIGDWAAVDTLPMADEATWWGLEILAGHPVLDASAQGEYIPQMLNLQALGGISFNKGCYIGQETVARARYRGANHHALFVLHGELTEPLPADLTLEWQLENGNWKRVGHALACWQQDGGLLLNAVLPDDLPATAALRLKAAPQVTLQLHPLPYALDA